MFIRLLALILFIIIIPLALLENASAQPTIAIMDFTGRGVTQDDAAALTDRLRTELVETGKWRVVEREMMNALLAEHAFRMTGCVEDKCIVAAGQVIGAAQMVAGSISKVGSVYSVAARVVDVETGEIIETATYDHEGDIGGLLKTGMRVVAGKLANIDAREQPLESGTSSKQQSTLPAEMVYVEGGSFMMGSNDGENDEKPVHQVTLDGFYVGKYEVTVDQFQQFVSATGYRTDAEKGGGARVWTGDIWTGIKWEQKKDANWRNPYFQQTDNSPVTCVSWNDAVTFCNWKSDWEGLTRAYRINGSDVTCNFEANGYRLPTEAEWEYAARGGSRSQGYKYSGGNNLDEVGWYRDNSNIAQSVGLKKPNELGCYDMSGSVWEWCWDWFGKYSAVSTTDLHGPNSGKDRVSRGGGWYGAALGARVANRNSCDRSYSNCTIGFRLCRTAK